MSKTYTLRDHDNRDDDGAPYETTGTADQIVGYLDGALRADITDREDFPILDAAILAVRADDISRADAELRHFAVRLFPAGAPE